MTPTELRTLVDFNYWSRDRVLAAVMPLPPDEYTRDRGSSFKSIRDTLVHIYSAEWVWLQRWHGQSPTAPLVFTDYPDVQTLATGWHDLEAQYRSLVAGLTDADATRVIDYKLMNGQPGRSVFWHMLQHVVNHGSYHRGQVTTMLRQMAAAPPKSVDLITYYRESGI